MIGVFDSGIGGLTILKALADRFPNVSFCYLGDHANVPYGNRAAEDIITLTREGVEHLFRRGARLVVLGCNTATAVAARPLQQAWLPGSGWTGRNVLGIVAPTVEAATQTPWAVMSPQYPQMYNSDVIAVFGTERTISTGVYTQEIRKRCPRVTVVEQVAADLAGAIEAQADDMLLDRLVGDAVMAMLDQTGGTPPHRAILGCTHFPLVEGLFRKHLPAMTRFLSQPEVVADSLENYLERHPEFIDGGRGGEVELLTTGVPEAISGSARVFWPDAPRFLRIGELAG
ncbi:MAG: Glutamate racemase [Pseudomonadota bacterium]|jgi:glutamate racemase